MSSLVGPANSWICRDCLGINQIPKEGDVGICSTCTKTSWVSQKPSSVSFETPAHRLARLTEKANESRLSPVVANWIEARCTLRAKEGKKKETIHFSELLTSFAIKSEDITSEKGRKWFEWMGYEVTSCIEAHVDNAQTKTVGITLSWGHHIK